MLQAPHGSHGKNTIRSGLPSLTQRACAQRCACGPLGEAAGYVCPAGGVSAWPSTRSQDAQIIIMLLVIIIVVILVIIIGRYNCFADAF